MFSLPEHVLGDLLAVFLFGVVAVAVIVAGTKLIDHLYKKVDLEAEVHKGNLAAAIVLSSIILGLCYVMACSIKSVLGVP